MSEQPNLILKWGTIKGWHGAVEGSPLREALERWSAEGVSASAMAQRNSDNQKQAICDAIEAVYAMGGDAYSDWSGETYETAEAAKKYIMEYGA